MLSSDIIAVSESRLMPSDDAITYSIPEFTSYRFDAVSHNDDAFRPYRGIVVYSKIPFNGIKRLDIMGNNFVLLSTQK